MSYHLFQAYGVELEYMVVDRDTLTVAPVVDELLLEASRQPGASVDDEEDPAHPGAVEMGPIAWSNELTLHVLEFKTASPTPALGGVASNFHEHVVRANQLLAPRNAMLMPGGMHPTMNPDTQMKLWPHGYSDVYAAFDRIFDCSGHGWANLQSAHLNLPFHIDADTPDSEFGRLHGAVRFLLPIMPALAASSPMMDGKLTGLMDNRLDVYRHNARKLPIISGRVIPEAVFTKAEYERVIFGAIYAALAPHDPQGVLRHEWANARGAIARFMRDTIEVRVLDVQECPAADLAILAAISSVLRALCEGRLSDPASLRRWDVEPLRRILMGVIAHGDNAVIEDTAYLRALGVSRLTSCSVRELWAHLVSTTLAREDHFPEFRGAIDLILSKGCLARRLAAALGREPSPERTLEVYRQLPQCLAQNRMFTGV